MLLHPSAIILRVILNHECSFFITLLYNNCYKMSFTRFHDDPARIQKSLEEIKSQEQYVFNTPGVGGGPFLPYLSDPHVRLQKWGGNVQ